MYMLIAGSVTIHNIITQESSLTELLYKNFNCISIRTTSIIVKYYDHKNLNHMIPCNHPEELFFALC